MARLTAATQIESTAEVIQRLEEFSQMTDPITLVVDKRLSAEDTIPMAFKVLYTGLVIAFGLAMGVQAIDAPEGIRSGRGDERKLIGRQHIVRRAVVLALYVSLAFLPFADRRAIGVLGDALLMRWIGLILAALGLGLVF